MVSLMKHRIRLIRQEQMESGKNTLDAQRTKANTQLAKAQTALTDGQLSLAQKEVQVTSSITNLKVQKQSLQTSLKTLKNTDRQRWKNRQNKVPDAATKDAACGSDRRTEKAGDNSKKFDQSIG